MTKDDFIFNLKRCGCLYKDGNTYYEENELIECFEDVGAFNKEQSSDLISRQAVIDLISKFILEIHTEGGRDLNAHTNDVLRQILRNVGSDRVLPSVNPQEPKIGHWIRWYEQKENDRCIEHIPHCKCSECGKEYDPYSSQFIKYCSECGAKMVEVQE